MRGGEIGHVEDSLEAFQRLGRWGVADARPERAVAIVSCGEEIVLRPSEQGRDQQGSEVEIVQRLHREAGGGEQILHGERRREEETVDSGDRHAFGVQAGDDEGGKIAAAADEDEDVLGSERTAAACDVEGVIEPVADLAGEFAGVAARRVADPALLPRLIFGKRHFVRIRLPQGDGARPARVRAVVRIWLPRQAERVVAEIGDDAINRLQDLRRRAEAAVHRQVEEIPADAAGLAVEPGTGDVETGRVRALEAEDRLLVIADCEDGAVPRGGALTGEIFEGYGPNDVPLPLVGVLRLVDEDVVGRLVKLVADPVAHAGGKQKLLRPADEIIKIHHAVSALRCGISNRESLAGAKACSQQGHELCNLAHRDETSATFERGGGETEIVRVLRRLSLAEAPDAAVRLGPDQVKLVEHQCPFGWRGGGPLLAEARPLDTAFGCPLAVHEADPPQCRHVEDIVATIGGDRLLDISCGNAEHAAEARLDPLPRAKLPHRGGRPCAAHQQSLGSALAEPVAE